MPFSLGIMTSIKIKSNRPERQASTAFSPSATTVTVCPPFSSMSSATFWFTGLSSASRMFSFGEVGAFMMGKLAWIPCR